MTLVLIIMLIGIFCGYLIRNHKRIKVFNDKLTNIAIYALLLLLGISVGANKTIIQNIHYLGITALIITMGSISGSVFILWFIYKRVFISKQKTINNEK